MKYSSGQIKIRELLIRLVENDIDDEGVVVLNRWFNKNSNAVNDYCEFVKDYAAIRLSISSKVDTLDSSFDKAVWAALKEVEDTAPVIQIRDDSSDQKSLIGKIERSKTPHQIKKSSLVTAIASLAALLMVVTSIQFLPKKSSKPVASVTSHYNAIWSGAGEAMPMGTRLWNDGRQYRLERGVAEVTFDSGATVLIEAPAQLELFNENEMSFEGSLTAYVPLAAHGFLVHTQNSTVTDFGTEFGLLANRSGSQVHVRSGNVEVAETLSSQKSSLTQMIQSGQGYKVNKTGMISEVAFQAKAFRWETPDTYEQAVYKTNPICYWRFDRDTLDELVNEMDLGDSQSYFKGRVQFEVPGPNLGSNKTNNAIRLMGLKDAAQDIIPAGYGFMNKGDGFWSSHGYAIALWIYPEALGTQNIVVHTEVEIEPIRTLNSYSDQIYINNDNQIAFYVYCSKSAHEGLSLQSINATEAVQLNTWYHIVASYSESGNMKLYVNGKLKAAKRLPSEPELYRYGYIGCATVNPFYVVPGNDRRAREPFTGMIDEISQYNRELTAQEVGTLYQAATDNR